MCRNTRFLAVIFLAAAALLGYGGAFGLFTPLSRATAQQAGAAKPITFTIQLPADATLEIDGNKTTETGSVRSFVTPPLPVEGHYTYTLKATSQGKEVTRQIHIASGVDNSFDLRAEFRPKATVNPDAKRLTAVGSQAAPGAPGQARNADPAAADKEVLTSKASQRPAAASVNFRKELGLPYPTLSTLGARISSARRSADPVALANAANELAVAEKVSGKKASLTSATLIKEAADLAKLRRQATELQAVERVASQIQSEQDLILDLKKTIDLSNQIASSDANAFKANEEPTWTPRKLIVNNYTTQILDVYVNGNFKMRVQPGGMQIGTIEHRWNPTVLTAYGDEDTQTWGPQYLWGRFSKYTWNIN